MDRVRGKKLLLVEDEAIISMVTAKMLKGRGYEVITVNNGKKAVETAGKDSSIDLILMDIDLGSGINGPEAARQILLNNNIPIVFLTSHSEQSVVETVKEITRYGYVIKNSGDFVLLSSIEMAFELFDSHERLKISAQSLRISEERVRLKLDSILSPEGDIGILEFTDIIDTSMLQSILEDFNIMTGVSVGIVDNNGEVIASTGYNGICRKFFRANPESCRNCIESNTEDVEGIIPGSYKLVKCRNNMWEMATPIEIGGKTAGNLFLGQFMFDDDVIDYDFSRSQASRFGFDEAEFINSMESVPRYGRDEIFTAMTFYIKLLNIISKLSYSNIKLAKTLSERDRYSNLHKESEERLSDVTEYMADLVARLDTDGFYKYVSPSFERVLGYRQEELLGTWAGDIIHPENRELDVKNITGMCIKGEGSVELKQRHKDGSYRWFEVTGRNISGENGVVTGAVLGARDITEKKIAEKKLNKKNKQYRELFESMIDGFALHEIIVDDWGNPVDYVFLEVNPAFESYTGLDPEVIIGKRVTELIPDIEPYWIATYGQVAFTGVRLTIENFSRQLNKWFKVTAYSPERGYFATIFEDITGRKKAEELLIERDVRYKRLFESVVGYIYTVFIENKSPVRTVHGPGCEAVTGYTPEDFAADPELWYKMIYPDDRGRVVLFASDIMNRGVFSPIEHRIICRDGSMAWVRNTPVPHYDDDKNLIEYDSVIADITERKVAETALKDSEEMLLNIINSSPDYIFVKGTDLKLILCNKTYALAMNKKPRELIGLSDIEAGWGEDNVKGNIQKGIRGWEQDDLRALAGEKVIVENESAVINGMVHYFDTVKTPLYKNGEITSLLGISRDMTERRVVDDERRAIIDLLSIINADSDLHDFMKSVIIFLKNWSGCEAVGIRLKEGDDYPYFETDGFSREFVKLENSLCAYDINGQLLRDDIGNPVIECMCGNIIRGRFDPSKPFFTGQGSFWSNCTTDLLKSTTDEDRQARTRNRCNGMGYESVALIPLRTGGKTFGTIQLNDKRKGMFTEKLINLFEHFGNNIAIALSEKLMMKELEESETRYRLIVDKNPDLLLLLRNGKYIFANIAGAEILGFKMPGDVIGKDVADTLSQKDMLEIKKREKRAMTGDANPPIELTFVRPDGTGCLTESASFPITLPDGPAVLVMGKDITEKRKLEKRIAADYEKYRTIADFPYDWEFWIGTDGRMIYCSPSCERITGYTKDEFVNDQLLFRSLVFPDDCNSPCFKNNEVHQFPEENETEFRITTRDGSVKWIGHTCRAVYDNAGNFAGRRGSNRDITEQKIDRMETETALARLDDLWNVAKHADDDIKTICDNILATIVRITDSRYGFYGFINDDEKAMTIYSWSGEAMKDCMMDQKPQQYQISECGIWAEAVRLREDIIINDYSADNPAKKGLPSGHVKVENLMVIPVFVNGRIKSVAAVANSKNGYSDNERINLKIFMSNIQAVIQKRMIEEKLRESESKLKALMNSTTDGVFLMTPDGIVLEANQTLSDRFGVSVDQMIGSNMFSYFSPGLAASRLEKIKEVISAGQPLVISDERGGLSLDSHIYPIKNSAGEVVSIAVFSRDVSESRKSFETINSLLKEKELLLSEVHHRIKNNMNTISGLLMLQAASMSDAAAITALNDARSRVQSMMLMYDKLYRSEDYRKMHIKEYFEKFIDEIFLIFENARQITIIKEIDDFILDTKTIFPVGIAINELITNAFKYAFPDGREGIIKVSIKKENDNVTLCISDDGAGVSDEVIASGSGGFGLNLVSALAEQIGGTVSISKKSGTRVEIVFSVGV